MTQMPCKHCGTSYSPSESRRRKIFCSRKCALKWHYKHGPNRYVKKEWDRSPRICEYSGIEFVPKSSNQKYAKKEYGLLAAEERSIKKHGVSLPCDNYVYAWYDGNTCFYVGKGTKGRAWDTHTGQMCQQMRDKAKGFRVEIIQDNLTDKQAHLAETCLIKFAKPEANMVSGVSPHRLE